ncbi:MAG: glycosyltransferase family 4 protein [Tenacibaculum sp.]|nr:glycosyltransferase family 4 protein [Tenacibaculum sp.]
MNYLVVFLILTVLSFFYLKIADKFNIVDKPNHRSSHTIPTIRGGGILFYLGCLIFFISSGFQYPYFFIGVSLVALISFIDDILTLSSSVRLPFQFLAVGLSFYEIGMIPETGLWILPFFILGVGLINEYNFMDGINGITGFYSLVTLGGLFIINEEIQVVNKDLLLYVLMSVIVFGFYNFRKKARMFAGDIGSISMAVLICFVGASIIYKTHSPIILLLISVYSVDAILTVIYRKSIGEKLTEPHRKHIYQKLVHTAKMPHLNVSIIYALLQMVINVIVLYTYKLDLTIQFTTLVVVILFLIFLYVLMFKRLEVKE